MANVATLSERMDPVISGLGYELVGVEFLSQGRHSMLRVYIDQADGIKIEDCEKVSRQLSAWLDVEDPVSGEYRLEVSSPGLERPLFRVADYERFAGQLARLKMRNNVDGRRKFTGRLKGLDGDDVLLEVDGEDIRLRFDEIEKAHLVADW